MDICLHDLCLSDATFIHFSTDKMRNDQVPDDHVTAWA